MHGITHSEGAARGPGGDAADAAGIRLLPGVLLALLAALPIAGTLLVAQVLPQMEAAFVGTPDVRLRVAIALTIPALAIALCSWAMGRLADRVGKRRLLSGALIFYALFGLAPLFLQSLDTIIAARAGMGIAEGVIMTCSTALIGDLYGATQRERLLSVQTACASVAAVVFAIIGGALGDIGWRAPFAVYAIALVMLPAMLFLVPADGAADGIVPRRAAAGGAERLPLARLAGVCCATLILSLGFYAAQIQIPYLLNAVAPVAPSTVGMVSALTNIAVVAGTACFAFLRVRPLRGTSLACFILVAVGLALCGLSRSYVPLCIGLIIVAFAGGIALPTFLNGAIAMLNPAQRGAGAGLWQSSFWAGQFLSPILVIALAKAAGTLSSAVLICAMGVLLLGTWASLRLYRAPGAD